MQRHNKIITLLRKQQPKMSVTTAALATKYTGWLKKVSCYHSTTAYFFEPPCKLKQYGQPLMLAYT